MSSVFGQNILGWLENNTTDLDPWLAQRAALVLGGTTHDEQSIEG